MTFHTGWFTTNFTAWHGTPVHLPASLFPSGAVNASGTVIGPTIPWLEDSTPIRSWPEDNGTWHAKAWIDTNWGLSLSDVQFRETAAGTTQPIHHLARFLQWRNLRLIFEDVSTTVSLEVRTAKIKVISILPGGGKRLSDNKTFAWGINATSTLEGIGDPRSANANVTYNVEILHTYLIARPKTDQDPAGAVLAIKVFPTLTISLQAFRDRVPMSATGPSGLPAPSIGADLKMVHGPKLTRDVDASVNHAGQRRPDRQYLPPLLDPQLAPAPPVPFGPFVPVDSPELGPGDVFAYASADSNDPARPNPADIPATWDPIVPFFSPQPAYWDVMFDYVNPWIRYEQAFDAVIFPRRSRALPRPRFDIHWRGASGLLACYREPGQGEYDNLHISPYLGFDDPVLPDPVTPTLYPLVEAPLAADEIIHLHWRWGPANPDRAEFNEARRLAKAGRAFKGWSDAPLTSAGAPSQANLTAGAPMLPAHHSLRIKLARAWPGSAEDNADTPATTPPDSAGPPASPLAALKAKQLAVWYAVTAHSPALGTYTQFFGQGYSLGYHLETLTAGGTSLENWELLTPSYVDDHHLIRKPGYHDLRWQTDTTFGLSQPSGRQRVPSASDIPGISRNKLTPNDPAFTQWVNDQWDP